MNGRLAVGGRGLRELPPGARRELLRVLTSTSDVRADVIRQFHERPSGRDMAELFIELEIEEWKRQLVIERLRAMAT